MPPKHLQYQCAECRAPLVPVYVVYVCRVRECPYGREGKGKRTWTQPGVARVAYSGDDEVVYEWPPPPPVGCELPPPGAPPPGAPPPGHPGKGKDNDDRLFVQFVRSSVDGSEEQGQWKGGRGYVWPPRCRKGNGQGNGNDEVVFVREGHQGKGKDKGSWMRSPHSQGRGQGQGGRGYVWPPAAIVDAFIRKGKGKEDEDVEMSDDSQEMWDALIEERKGKGHVFP